MRCSGRPAGPNSQTSSALDRRADLLALQPARALQRALEVAPEAAQHSPARHGAPGHPVEVGLHLPGEPLGHFGPRAGEVPGAEAGDAAAGDGAAAADAAGADDETEHDQGRTRHDPTAISRPGPQVNQTLRLPTHGQTQRQRHHHPGVLPLVRGSNPDRRLRVGPESAMTEKRLLQGGPATPHHENRARPRGRDFGPIRGSLSVTLRKTGTADGEYRTPRENARINQICALLDRRLQPASPRVTFQSAPPRGGATESAISIRPPTGSAPAPAGGGASGPPKAPPKG